MTTIIIIFTIYIAIGAVVLLYVKSVNKAYYKDLLTMFEASLMIWPYLIWFLFRKK